MKREDFEYLENFLKSGKISRQKSIVNENVIKAEMIDLLNQEVKETVPVDSFDSSVPDNLEKKIFEDHILQEREQGKRSHIEVIKKGDIIEHIIVYCKCGEVIKIDLK